MVRNEQKFKMMTNRNKNKKIYENNNDKMRCLERFKIFVSLFEQGQRIGRTVFYKRCIMSLDKNLHFCFAAGCAVIYGKVSVREKC